MDKDYQLTITITRHGPKSGLGGDLTPEGKEFVSNHYKNLSDELRPTYTDDRKIVSSPVNRAIETATLYKDFLKSESDSSLEIEAEQNLSEQGLVDFVYSLPLEQQQEWFQYWYKSEQGKAAISKFSSWVLEQITNQKQSEGALRIDAFSHGPVMAGFILRVEEITNQKIISINLEGTERLNDNHLFGTPESLFNYMGCFEINSSSDDADSFTINIDEKNFKINESILQKLMD